MAVADNNSEIPPLPELRGIDPIWNDLDYQFATILVKASCEDVAEVLRKRKDVNYQVRDLRFGTVSLESNEWERALFVFQLNEHHWAQISGVDWWLINHDLPKSLSKRLRATVFQHFGEGVYQGYNSHMLFEMGKHIEDQREADQAALELGLFVAYEVWSEDEGRVVCWKGWDLSVFRSALLLSLKA